MIRCDERLSEGCRRWLGRLACGEPGIWCDGRLEARLRRFCGAGCRSLERVGSVTVVYFDRLRISLVSWGNWELDGGELWRRVSKILGVGR